ncbi:MAG: hypothetical protein CMO11_03420 [Thaumarchaeota archaeon]|nr:hypothetical protein [Nitrososphaerota archaeon]
MGMQNNKIIVIGLALILSSVLSYSIFGSNQEQQTEIGVIETVKEFDLSIVERKLTLDPPIISVNVGDKILLRIQSDEELMFHIHEYDHEVMIIPGKIEELSFPATIPGRFEMEIHVEEHEMDEMDMEMDFSNAKISINSVEVMDNMATVNVEIEGIMGDKSGIHWHLKLDQELLEKDDHAAIMVFGKDSYILHGISKGEHTVYVALVNSEHELVSEIASQIFVIETDMDVNGMNMEEKDGHEDDKEPIFVGILEVMPK